MTTFRTIIAKVLSLLRNISGTGYSLSHLRFFQDAKIGPIQRDEALLLYAMVKTVDPKTIVELGFYEGHSSINFLKAMSSDARLFSYDITEASRKLAMKIEDKRFKFVFKSQSEFEPSDVDNRLIDLVLFDAAHDFQLNVTTFQKLIGSLMATALIVVHDTGAWYGNLKGLMTPQGHFSNELASSAYIHQPGERAFVNWAKETMKDFNQIHLHSTSKFRHGMTVFQKNDKPLAL